MLTKAQVIGVGTALALCVFAGTAVFLGRRARRRVRGTLDQVKW